MKKAFRILAVVLAATMLMCCCAMATTISYKATCNSTRSSAESNCSDPGFRSAQYGGVITRVDNSEFDVSGYDDATSGKVYCFTPYVTAAAGFISSSHVIAGHGYTDGDSF